MEKDNKLLNLSGCFDNIINNKSINDTYEALCMMDSDVKNYMISVLDSVIAKEMVRIQNVRRGYNKDLFLYAKMLKNDILSGDNIERFYFKLLKLYPDLKNSMKDIIRLEVQKEIENLTNLGFTKRDIQDDLHPILKEEIYGNGRH